eukprot:TRINITY_DN408_c0_g1_i1.p1 TRINITY_DN408_c0_g1~~TRINITY_DN408_c0_g1_i1.p1  ORF type:complete len:427 (-),score=158.50 TRINITY_DN408_c0_g1_i1:285-1427(-)
MDDITSVNANWVTNNSAPAEPYCVYGNVSGVYPQNVTGVSYTYSVDGFNGTIHNAVMTDLVPGMRYYYRCGDNNSGLTAESYFKTNNDVQTPFTIAATGDMGVEESARTTKGLMDDTSNELFDWWIHVGDTSYADDFPAPNAHIWDDFMNQVAPITARLPLMNTVGNHERQYNFSAYLNRMSMPSERSGSRFWYSFDYNSLVHFVAFSTEHDFSNSSEQHAWLVKDLAAAYANKHNVPWIVVFGHRPFYCTSVIEASRCEVEAPEYRSYLEDAFHDYQVDLVLSGHNHNYERTYPVYQLQPTNGTSFINPTAPVYIVNGAAGCPEFIDPSFKEPGPNWRASCRPAEWGYGRLSFTATTLHWQWVDDYTHGVSDEFTIERL